MIGCRVAVLASVISIFAGHAIAACGPARVDRPEFEAPAPGSITSRYGMALHPLLNVMRHHDGVDFEAPTGTPVRAAAPGEVLVAGRRGEDGNRVDIDHGAGWTTRYSHMSRIAVAEGACVARGDVIGWVGSTGLAAGPHLHFEIRNGDRPLDPGPLLSLAGQR